MGYDQWFRLFFPVTEDALERLPDKLTTATYLAYLTIAKAVRPHLRNYSVRAYRADVHELDVDFVLHGSVEDGTAGPATAWALRCEKGDRVAIVDEGITCAPPADARHLMFVADESAMPAVAGILASLPRDARGHAMIEI